MTSLAMWSPGPLELGVIVLVALLIFGRRLPEVMRSMGRGVVEFKRGLKGVEDDMDSADDSNSQRSSTEPKKVSPPPSDEP